MAIGRRAADSIHARVAVGCHEHFGVNRDVGGGAARSRRRERNRRRGRDGVEGVLGEEDEGKAGRGHRDRTRVGGLVAGDGRHI